MTPETQAISEALCRRIQGEFLEMPGLRLTSSQACRLWGLDRDVCGQLLAQLVDAKFLTRTRDGSFMQLDRTQAVEALPDASLIDNAPVSAVIPLCRRPSAGTAWCRSAGCRARPAHATSRNV